MSTTIVNLKDIIAPAVAQELRGNPSIYASDVPGPLGPRGPQGISVHHTKATSTNNPLGDFGKPGYSDTYTFYGDADETLNLGWYTVYNGKNSLDIEEIAYYYELNPDTNKYTDAEKASVDIDTPLNTVANTLPTSINEVLSQLSTEIISRNAEVLKNRQSIGLTDNGSYVVDSNATYINSATTIHNATQVLDSSLKDLNGVVASEHNRAIVKEDALQAELDATQTGAGLNNDGSYEASTKPYVSSANSLRDADDKLADALSNIEGIKFDKIGGLISGDVEVTGNVTVNGDFTTVSSNIVQVSDKNIELGVTDDPTDFTADGGGITLLGDSNKTILWKKARDAWEFSSPIFTDLVLKTPRTLAFTGDVTGTGTFDGTSDLTFTMSVVDNSHKHVIANITGLQATLDTLQAGINSRYLIEEW